MQLRSDKTLGEACRKLISLDVPLAAWGSVENASRRPEHGTNYEYYDIYNHIYKIIHMALYYPYVLYCLQFHL